MIISLSSIGYFYGNRSLPVFTFETKLEPALLGFTKQGNPTFLQFRLYKFYHLYLSNRKQHFYAVWF
jgi:hypothetical protein